MAVNNMNVKKGVANLCIMTVTMEYSAAYFTVLRGLCCVLADWLHD